MTRTSVTSNSIATGSKTFAYAASTSLGWFVGTRLRVANDSTHYMEGVITSVSSTSVTLTVDLVVGSGTFTAWNLGITGEQGTTGPSPVLVLTSTTSAVLGASGSKTLNFASTLHGFTVGQRVRFLNDSTHYMEGVVNTVSSTSMTIVADYVVGSGTFTAWTIMVTGDQGPSGSYGATPSMIEASTTSNTISSSGSKTFAYTSDPLLTWFIGQRLRAVNDASNYMEGVITAVSATSVTITADYSVGSGTFTTWTLGIAGDRGAVGPAGASATIIETSTTSNTLAASGSKSWSYTSDPLLAWVVGQRLRAINDSTHYMEGIITAVSATSVTLTIDYNVGSGTFSAWTLALIGDRGATGNTGAAWPAFSFPTAKTANYTAVSSDFSGNKAIEMDLAGANTFTVNSGLTGIEPLIVIQKGLGQTTIVAGSSVTILSSAGLKLRAQNSICSLIPMGTNIYRMSGDTTA
jgi:hypothetical protein